MLSIMHIFLALFRILDLTATFGFLTDCVGLVSE